MSHRLSHHLSNTIQTESPGQVDVPTRVEVHVMGIPDMCREHRCLTTFQKQHRQNEPAFQVNISTGVEICVIWDPGHIYGTQTSHRLSKTTQTV